MSGKDLRRGGVDRLTVEDILTPGFSTPWDAPTIPTFPFAFRNVEVLDSCVADSRGCGRAPTAAAARTDIGRRARTYLSDERRRLAWSLRREQRVGRLQSVRART